MHDFKYAPENFNEARISASDDEVRMQYSIFDETSVSRAETMSHEAIHVIFCRYKHKNTLAGSTSSGPCSEDWFFYDIRDPAGNLDSNDKNQSMNQLQSVFLYSHLILNLQKFLL